MRFALGTYVRIKVWGVPDSLAEKAVQEAFREIERAEELTSVFSTRSGLYELNSKGKVVSSELAGLVKEALDIARKSRGRFDPTIKPLIDVWGFYDTTGNKGRIPSDEEIKAALELLGHEQISVYGDTVRFDHTGNEDQKLLPGVDLSGIAKGYAVDKAVRVLAELGVRTALVDAGGDIFCLGKKDAQGWKIGIRHPRREQGQEILGVVGIDSGAVATSGDYENYFTKDGIRYHHLLDPVKGYPARGAMSATVTASTATLADGWATALLILGEEGLEILEEMEGIEGLLVPEDGRVIKTSKFPKLEKL